MSEPDPAAISITLSPGQVEEVVRAAAGGSATVSHRIAGSLASPPNTGAAATGSATDGAAPAGGWPTDTADRRLSRSLLRGLSILTRFGPERPERGIVGLAAEMGMSASTAHRYAQTLVELGLLERSRGRASTGCRRGRPARGTRRARDARPGTTASAPGSASGAAAMMAPEANAQCLI